MNEEELREYCTTAGKKICDQEYEIRKLKQQKKNLIKFMIDKEHEYEKMIKYYEYVLKNNSITTYKIIYIKQINSLNAKRILIRDILKKFED